MQESKKNRDWSKNNQRTNLYKIATVFCKKAERGTQPTCLASSTASLVRKHCDENFLPSRLTREGFVLDFCPTFRILSFVMSGKNLMKMIQDWLGHSDMATTANIYSHIDSTSKRETAQAIGELLG